jgi:hypothetical protein
MKIGKTLLLTALGLSLAGVADAVVLCRKGTRVIARDAACKGRETLLDMGFAGPKGDPGAKGDAGLNGADGQNGQNGTNATTNVVVREAQKVTANGQNDNATANCLPGEVAVGGGSELVAGSILNMHFFGDNPVPSAAGSKPTGWSDSIYNDSGQSNTWRVYVICASP